MTQAAAHEEQRPDSFESLLSLLGGRGRHAQLTLLIMIVVNMYPASITLSYTFTNAAVNFSCDLNASLDASAAGCWAAASDDQCEVSVICSDSARRLPCRRWSFDTSEFSSTIASRFQLVCADASLADLSATIFFAGFLVGSTLYGLLSDAFGRQKAALLSICHLTACNVAAALAPQFWMFAAAMTLAGAGTGGLLTIIFAMVAESTDARNRFYWCSILSFGWVLGVFLTTLVSFLTRSYELHLLWLSAGAVVYLLLTAVVGESARWLVTTRRMPQAQAAVLRVARINAASHRLPPNFSVEEVAPRSSGSGGGSVADLFRTPGIRRITLLGWVHWFAASMTYYGISFGAASFGGSIFVNALLVSAVELPAKAIGMGITACGVGRKPVLYVSFLLSAVFLAITAATFNQQQLVALRIALAVVSKLCITVAFDFVWVYYTELYPTVIRTVGIGSGSTMARVGAMVSTQMLPLGSYWPPLPFVIFCIGPFVACLVMYFLPETCGRQLPETIADGEAFVRDSGGTRVGDCSHDKRLAVQ